MSTSATTATSQILEQVETNERAFLGALMQLPARVDVTKVTAYHFANVSYGKLFDLICNLYRKGDGLDRIVLGVEAVKAGIKLTVDEILDLFDEVPNPGNISYYERQVIDACSRRQYASVADFMNQNVGNMSVDVAEIVASAQQRLSAIGHESVDYLVPVDKAVDQLYEQLFNADQDVSQTTFSTGFRQLDGECGLWRAGEMIVLAARPGCGKTSFAVQVAEHFADSGHHTMITSLEMESSELVKRSLSAVTGIQARNIDRGMSDQNVTLIKQAMPRVAASSMTYFVPPKTNMQKIRAAAKLLQARHQLKFIVVDYIGLIEGRDNLYEKTTEHSKQLKQLAREMSVPVLVLSQLNRKAEGMPPTLDHLRDSGAIEQDADRVMFLHPDDWAAKHRDKFYLTVAKNRNGPRTQLELVFDGERTRFETGPKKFMEFC